MVWEFQVVKEGADVEITPKSHDWAFDMKFIKVEATGSRGP